MRTIIFSCAALLIACSSAPTFAFEMGDSVCCGPDGCDLGMIEDHLERLKASDDELNRTYAAVLETFHDQPNVIAAIRKAQRNWIELRDLDFEATRLSWKGVADIDTPGIENSLLFAGISETRNLARASFLCTAYLIERG